MGLAIALIIHSVDPSLSSQLILAQRVGEPNPYENCLNVLFKQALSDCFALKNNLNLFGTGIVPVPALSIPQLLIQLLNLICIYYITSYGRVILVCQKGI